MRAAALLLAFVLLACTRQSTDASQNAPSEATTVAGNTATAPTNTVNPPAEPERDQPGSRVTPAPYTQEVQLIEYAIRMPETIPAGKISFHVQNAGSEKHGFEIEGNGIEQKTEVLQRGDTTSLDAELKPGTYTVYCPVKGHKEKGMRMVVTVK